MTMRIVLGQAARPTEEYLTFASQLGMTGVQLNTPDLPGEQRWDVADLVALRGRVESYGLRLEAIENVPNHFYEKAMLGVAGRDEEIENVAVTIRNMGRAGIPLLGFNWLPTSVWRTELAPVGRGGAVVSGFDLARAEDGSLSGQVLVARRDRRVEDQKDSWSRDALFDLPGTRSDEDMWASYEYFVDALVPVAEEAGVRLALHPDDPPVPTLGGMSAGLPVCRRVEARGRALAGARFRDRALSRHCLRNGRRGGCDRSHPVPGPRDKIAYVHLRDVKGTVPAFVECFLGEGNYKPARVIRELSQSGYDGFIMDDHTPALVGDSSYGHRGRAFALGYIQGLIDMMELDDVVANVE